MDHKNQHPCHRHEEQEINRREFIKVAGVSAAAIALASCQKGSITQTTGNTQTSGSKPRVAIAQATDYNADTLDKKVAEMIDQLGGLGDVVKSGDSVAIKINMTGGLKSGELPGIKPIDSFITHPLVLQSLIKRSRIVAMSFCEPRSW